MSELIRTGVVGLGRMGKVRLEAIRGNARLQLIAVCDVDETTAGRGLDSLRRARDYRDMLEMDLDAVFVCTPNRYSPQVVIRALELGKHVFCEKPPGCSVTDIQAIIDVEKQKRDLVLKFGFNHRYHAAVSEAKKIIDSGRLGRLLWIRGIYGKSGGSAFEQSWRSKKEIAGGGILLDQGIHMIDLFRYFCGEFDEVKSYVTRAYWRDTDVEDNAFALLRNSRRDLVAMLHSSSTHWKHAFSLDACLSDGYVTIGGILSSTRSYGRESLVVGRRHCGDDTGTLSNPREEIVYYDQDPSWQREVDEFADAILDGRRITHGTSEDALKAMELVSKIYAADDSWRG